MPATHHDHPDRPEFAVAVRGYDRTQVDRYVDELVRRAADAERKATDAEQASDWLTREVAQLRAAVAALEERAGMPAPQSMSAFGERLGEMMQQAVVAAQELRTEAEREAHERREAMDREAAAIVERARQEALGIVEEARTTERAMEEQLTVLAARRAAALAEIARLHGHLGELLTGVPVAGEVAEVPPAPAGVDPAEVPPATPGVDPAEGVDPGEAAARVRTGDAPQATDPGAAERETAEIVPADAPTAVVEVLAGAGKRPGVADTDEVPYDATATRVQPAVETGRFRPRRDPSRRQ